MRILRTTALFVSFLALHLCGCPGRCVATEQAAPDEARRLLDSAGIKGGLIVHLGCGDGRLTAALGESERFVVHGLDNDDDAIGEARRYISRQGVYGRTSVRRFNGDRLPYVDNLVNLVVASDRWQGASGEGQVSKEIARILAPGGAALFLNRKSAIENRKWIKPWPAEIDEWTHFLHGPDNNAVAQDRVVGPPVHLQWLGWPRHLRSHEHLNSLSALVSARGQIFYIIDEGPTAAVTSPPMWRLVARDAFNGILLWKRDLGPWEGHFRLFRSGPPDVARRLVAVDDRVYATLGYGKRVAAFDAATGETVRTYDETEGALEIVHDNGRLFVLVGSIDEEAFAQSSKRYYPSPAPRKKGIVVVDAESGEFLWKHTNQDTASAMATTMAVSGQRLFFQNTKQLICLDAKSGQEQWRADRPAYTTRLSWSAPTLVVSGGVVLSADASTGGLPREASRGADTVEWIMSDRDIRKHPIGDLIAFSAQTGERLWSTESLQGFCCPGDIFVIDGLVWAGAIVAPAQQTLNVALDLKTGEVKRRRSGAGPPVGGHARCYRNKATERFLVLGGTGVEFVDVADWSWTAGRWVRGTCQYGVMPANGLLYVPPDSCACLPNTRLHGFTAMAPKRRDTKSGAPSPEKRLHRGPAYASIQHPASGIPHPVSSNQHPASWPTYRHDASRRGATDVTVPARVKPVWQADLGGRLSSPVIVDGRVYVSRVDAHAVYALDVESGETLWRHTVGGPVDSPPTVCRGLVVFGCRDGWVYCLRAADGELAWRFRAAPEDRLLMAPDGIESVWPVHGSVLVRDELVWFAAGRSSYLDGGIRLHAVELTTGKPVFERQLDGRDPASWNAPSAGRGRVVRNRLQGTLPDVLSSSDEVVFMGWTCFDGEGKLVNVVKPHLFSATGFLDDTWWHRTYWQYGTWMRGGFGGWPQAARQVPAGRVLVEGGDAIFGFGRSKYDPGNPEAVHAGHIGVIKDGYQDSGRVDFSQNPFQLFAAVKPGSGGAKQGRRPGVEYKWQSSVPILGRAMVLANRTLFIAGPNAGQQNHGLSHLDTFQPGQLLSVSADDGKTLANHKLAAAPVLDGMAAVPGRLLIACTDGSVRCFADR